MPPRLHHPNGREWTRRGVNPAAEGVFGYTREQAVGQSSSLIIPEDWRDRTERPLMFRTGGGPMLGKRLEVKAIRADGCPR
jgi:PAS domain S-box-containing protein